jgi:hypothetical protein
MFNFSRNKTISNNKTEYTIAKSSSRWSKLIYYLLYLELRIKRYQLRKLKRSVDIIAGVSTTNSACTAYQRLPRRTALDPEWMGLQVWGARWLVFKFMDLFDTALQVQGPTMHLTHKTIWWERSIQTFILIRKWAKITRILYCNF